MTLDVIYQVPVDTRYWMTVIRYQLPDSHAYWYALEYRVKAADTGKSSEHFQKVSYQSELSRQLR